MGKDSKMSVASGKAPSFLSQRLFMRSGAVFTVHYIESEKSGGRTIYSGVNGVFLCDVQDEDVAVRVSMNVPTEIRDVPANGNPGAPLVKQQVPVAGSVEVIGYKFQ